MRPTYQVFRTVHLQRRMRSSKEHAELGAWGTGAEAEGLSAYLTTLARHSSVARASNAKSAVFAPTLVSCGRLAFMADAGRRALRSRSVNVFPLGRWRALRRRSRWRRVRWR